MYRYELRCYMCDTTIGYMSSPYEPRDNNPILDSVSCGNVKEPICCPVCKVRRLRGSKNENS